MALARSRSSRRIKFSPQRSGALSANARNMALPGGVWKIPDDFGSAGSRS